LFVLSSEDATFNVYYNGKFSVSSGNVLTYNGGEIHTLECKHDALFTNITESMWLSLFGQRIWYKLPYESFGE